MIKKNYIFLTILILSFFLSLGILGLKNLNPLNDQWLLSNDFALDVITWKYFFNDLWRFPLGSNPNYGAEISNSIIFSGSVPILSFIFKIFKSLLPDNFHFFSIWILISIFLQFLLSYSIFIKLNCNKSYSLVCSFFFVCSPIFINKFGSHLALTAHWLILTFFYIDLLKDEKLKKIYTISLLLFSCLIHFYFTIMLSIIFFIYELNKLINEKKFFVFLKNIFLLYSLLLILMYVVGYFSIEFKDTLGGGYGHFKLNLLSIFNPYVDQKSWSWLIPRIPTLNLNQSESFNYLGIGGIIIMIFLLFYFFKNIKNINFFKYRKIIFIFIIFSVLAISNRIEFADILLIEIKLNKYIYALTSFFRASGRLFWPCYYLILIFGLLAIYKSFSNKNSLLIVIVLFTIQILDTSKGIKEHFNGKGFNQSYVQFKDPIWKVLEKKYSIISSTYIYNEHNDFKKILGFLKDNPIKSEIVYLARIDRKKQSNLMYSINKNLTSRDLLKDKFFTINNLGHLNHLKYLYRDEEIGFVFRDNIWLLLPFNKKLMNKNDKRELKKIKSTFISKNEKILFNDQKKLKKMAIMGLGWSYSYSDKVLWSDGFKSSLIFNKDKNNENFNIILNVTGYVNKKNKVQNVNILINGDLKKTISFAYQDKLEKEISLSINDHIKKNLVIDFEFLNPVSKYDLRESIDTRKRGLKINWIKLI